MDIGNWAVEEVAGHLCDIFEPANVNPHGYVVMYLHGVHQGRLNDKVEFVEQFEQHGWPVICPRTERSWWSNRICAEFDANVTAEQYVLQSVVPYIEERWAAKATQIALLGTSMGGQGALRFSYKYPNLFPIAAAISPAVDHYTRMQDPEEEEPLFDMYLDPEDCRQDSALLHIHPLNWPRHQFFCCDPVDYRWMDSADRLRMKLGSLGVPFECDLETSRGGHGFSYYCTMAERTSSFIANALDRERLRVA